MVLRTSSNRGDCRRHELEFEVVFDGDCGWCGFIGGTLVVVQLGAFLVVIRLAIRVAIHVTFG